MADSILFESAIFYFICIKNGIIMIDNMADKITPTQAAWNNFQASFRILKKKQKQILSDFRARLEQQKIDQLKDGLR